MLFHNAPTTFVSQLHLYVSHVEGALKFYREVLGFSILERVDDKVILTADGRKPILTLETPKPLEARNPRSTGLYHFAILLPSRDDLSRFVMHLIKSKIPFGSADHLVSEAIYFSDPDHNGIEVYVDRHPDSWTWKDGQVSMAVNEVDYDDLLKNVRNLSTWETAPKQTVLGHIHLHVKDLKETVDFYTLGLGFNVVSRLGSQAVFLSDGGYHHHIGLNTWQGVGAPLKKDKSIGLHHFSVVYANESKRKEALDRLLKLGFKIEPVGDDWLSADPSMNQIKLTVGDVT